MNEEKNAIEIFNDNANAYQNKFMNTELYHNSFDLFCSNIGRKNADVLDIACGPGNIARYLLEKRSDLKVLGIDGASRMIELAIINNPTAVFQVMDCRNIGSIKKKWDAIMCGFCLPYLSKDEAIRLITDASNLLNPNGIFYLSTMEDDYNKSGLKTSSSGDQLYVYYHEADYLIQTFKETGFEIIKVLHQDYPTVDESKATDLIIIARKIK